jgi:hypothetical protein
MVEDDEKFAKDLLCTECWEVGHRLVFSDELHSNDGEPLMIKHIPTYECKSCNALSYSSDAIDYIQSQLKTGIHLAEELDMSEQFSEPVIYETNDPFDDSSLIDSRTLTLDDMRPVLAQAWAESGSSYVTYFLSKQSIENYNAEQLKSYLIKNGLNTIEKFSGKLYFDSMIDGTGLQCWRVTIVVGGEI